MPRSDIDTRRGKGRIDDIAAQYASQSHTLVITYFCSIFTETHQLHPYFIQSYIS